MSSTQAADQTAESMKRMILKILGTLKKEMDRIEQKRRISEQIREKAKQNYREAMMEEKPLEAARDMLEESYRNTMGKIEMAETQGYLTKEDADAMRDQAGSLRMANGVEEMCTNSATLDMIGNDIDLCIVDLSKTDDLGNRQFEPSDEEMFGGMKERVKGYREYSELVSDELKGKMVDKGRMKELEENMKPGMRSEFAERAQNAVMRTHEAKKSAEKTKVPKNVIHNAEKEATSRQR